MAEQILQCPDCQVRCRARSYEPGRRYACPKCGGRLVLTSALDQSAQTIIPEVSRDSEPDDDPLLGEQIGQYKILSRIGAGGMGVVYKAEHVGLRVVRALKILPQERARLSPKAVQRFMREARSAAILSHPNIVTVHNADEVAGWHLIDMEFVEGESLQNRLSREGRLSVAEATRIVGDVAQALASAHEKHIVHRDIKPANILLAKDGTVKVADFGLAKNVEDDPTVTEEGGHGIGTASFMSPEQCDGEALDGRSDIYSLGVTYFYLLTGELPFTGKSRVSVMLKHKTKPALNPRYLVPSLPLPAAKAVLKAMAKSPDDRYQTCEAMGEDLCVVASEAAQVAEQLPLSTDQAPEDPGKDSTPSAADEDGEAADLWLLNTHSIVDWFGFCSKLSRESRRSHPSPSKRVWELLDPSTRRLIEGIARGTAPNERSRSEVVRALNRLLRRRDLYEKTHFSAIAVPLPTGEALTSIRDVNLVADGEVIKCNRILLQEAYSLEIAKIQDSQVLDVTDETERQTSGRAARVLRSVALIAGSTAAIGSLTELISAPGRFPLVGTTLAAAIGVVVAGVVCAVKGWVPPTVLGSVGAGSVSAFFIGGFATQSRLGAFFGLILGGLLGPIVGLRAIGWVTLGAATGGLAGAIASEVFQVRAHESALWGVTFGAVLGPIGGRMLRRLKRTVTRAVACAIPGAAVGCLGGCIIAELFEECTSDLVPWAGLRVRSSFVAFVVGPILGALAGAAFGACKDKRSPRVVFSGVAAAIAASVAGLLTAHAWPISAVLGGHLGPVPGVVFRVAVVVSLTCAVIDMVRLGMRRVTLDAIRAALSARVTGAAMGSIAIAPFGCILGGMVWGIAGLKTGTAIGVAAGAGGGAVLGTARSAVPSRFISAGASAIAMVPAFALGAGLTEYLNDVAGTESSVSRIGAVTACGAVLGAIYGAYRGGLGVRVWAAPVAAGLICLAGLVAAGSTLGGVADGNIGCPTGATCGALLGAVLAVAVRLVSRDLGARAGEKASRYIPAGTFTVLVIVSLCQGSVSPPVRLRHALRSSNAGYEARRAFFLAPHDHIVRVWLETSTIVDLAPLASLPHLRDLELRYCYGVTDLEPLSRHPQLTELSLRGCDQVTDLSPVGSLPQLNSLALSKCDGVKDLSPVADLRQLTRLYLTDCRKVTDLTPLAKLRQLTYLGLCGCDGVTDLSPLTRLRQLTDLDLSYCYQVTDLSPLAGLTRLTNLNLSCAHEVTDEQVRTLNNRLPQCRIIR